MKTNKTTKGKDFRKQEGVRLAGGMGTTASCLDAVALLRRSVMANLLWEDNFYENGQKIVDNIKALVPQVSAEQVADIAVEARTKQKLRHVPLLLAIEMSKLDSHKGLVGKLLPQIILRADEITEFVSLYWQGGKHPLSKQVKVGLAAAFDNFDEYQLAKYNRDSAVKLRDVMFLTHTTPSQDKVELFKRLAEGTLTPPDTWEVALSSGADKKATWERLLNDGKLGALAFVRNLRNMEAAGVSDKVIIKAFETINARWLLPLDYLKAAKFAPKWERELEGLMLRGLSQAPRLPGHTIFVVDVSGSMNAQISTKSDFTRMDVAFAMAILASEMCERISVYATAGSDYSHTHQTAFVKPRRGFALADEIRSMVRTLGGGGIFTRQALEYINVNNSDKTPERIIVFSDSQDCDLPNARIPSPYGRYNYIVDVSAHAHGVNYQGVWTAEVSGWSEHFLAYIAALEGAYTDVGNTNLQEGGEGE